MLEILLSTGGLPPAEYSDSGPGPKTLIAGNEDIGFFGEVASSLLITPTALKVHLGLSAGTVIADAGWLKFIHNGVIKYVCKKTTFSSLSWNQLYAGGGIYGTDNNGLYPATTPMNQSKPITVSDGAKICTLVPKLISGSPTDPSLVTADAITDYNSEYSDLLYRIIDGTHANAGAFASYVKTDVNMNNAHTVVETLTTNTARHLIRGYQGTVGAAGQSLTKGDGTGYAQHCRMVLVLKTVV